MGAPVDGLREVVEDSLPTGEPRILTNLAEVPRSPLSEFTVMGSRGSRIAKLDKWATGGEDCSARFVHLTG
jgi:hypothetical protein